MDMIFLTGLWGGLVTVLGAACPEEKVAHPTASTKNWLLALGALILLSYAVLNYFFAEGSFFFVLLEGLVIVASVLMMTNIGDKINTIVLTLAGLGFLVWSFFLYEGLNTAYFIVGLTGVALGYALKAGTVRRFAALTLGSALIAVFSYLGGDMVFFGLNAFFALFSAYYLVKVIRA